jgi:hypothetical protein
MKKRRKLDFFKVTLRKSEKFFILEKLINLVLPNSENLEKVTTKLLIKNYFILSINDCSTFLEMEPIFQLKNRFISNSKRLQFFFILKTNDCPVMYSVANFRFLQIPFLIK